MSLRSIRQRTNALTAGTVALFALGCGSDRAQGTMTADLERDLQLASAPRPNMAVVSAIEGGPTNAPSGDQRGKRDNVVRPRQAPRPTPNAPITQEAPAASSVEEAPAPAIVTAQAEPAPAPMPESGNEAPAPRPTWGVIYGDGPTPSSGSSEDHGERGAGRGRNGGGGGVIIRGGGAGDDHCEPPGRRGRGGIGPGGMGGIGGGIIGVIGGIGGMGGGMGGIGRPTFPRF